MFGRIIAVALFTQIALAAPAYACQGPLSEYTVFLPAMPQVDEGTDFAGLVVLHEKRKWFFFKRGKDAKFEAEILQSPTHPEMVGTKLAIPFFHPTSCGPWLSDHDRGFVSGTLVETESERPSLTLDAHRNGDIFLN